jgi:hypothetical protein
MARAALLGIVSIFLFPVRTSANEALALANPMEKVIELLDVLAKQIETEGLDDAGIYKVYTKFYNNETKKGAEIIKDTSNKINQLTADLKEAEAFREGKNKDLVDLANKLAKSELELTSGRDNRKKERALFEKNEATYIESLEQLEHALVVMDKKAPTAIAASSSSSLLSIAQKLKNTLTEGSDITLSTAQRETLDGFMRAAAVQVQNSADAAPSLRKGRRVEAAVEPSFLQTDSSYKSGNDGLISTLKDLQTKVKNEREAALSEEEKAKKDFKDWESSLVTMLENGKKSLADIKTTIAQSQETSSQKQASLMEAKDINKAETEHMEQVEAEYRGKTQAYKIRLGKRSDEAVAVHEAQRIMQTEETRGYIKQQTVGSADNHVFFLQEAQEKHKVMRKAIQVMKVAPTPGLALLAMKTTLHLRHKHKGKADPFAKVKTMIKSMLEKLEDKQAQESKHAAWCDHEMGKTTKDKKRKEEDVQKMKDRLDALSADLTQTTAELVTVTADLAALQASVAEAKRIRAKEHTVAMTSIKQYSEATKLLKKAIEVLQTYYKNSAIEGHENNTAEFKDRKGLGAGIIGLLEIAADDFQTLHDDTKEAEEAAAKDFKEMADESAVREAVFQKDMEWKGRTKVKLEYDEATMKNDLKSYEKELLAIDSYMEKLKASCIVKGPTYEERKASREAKLKSLQDALTYLTETGVSR